VVYIAAQSVPTAPIPFKSTLVVYIAAHSVLGSVGAVGS
jgi:hypothetical protein